VALIAYLLVHILRHSVKSDISILAAMAALGTPLLPKEPLSSLLGSPPPPAQPATRAVLKWYSTYEMNWTALKKQVFNFLPTDYPI
jgi:hypothetical protein